MRFFLVRLENLTVGWGGVALFDDYAEVKRMYTRSAVRRLGLAKALLRRIEEEARTAACLCCESKPASINGRPSASMKLRAFGHAARSDPIQRCPAHKIETSLFFEKEL